MKRRSLWFVLVTLLIIAAILALGGRSCELRDGHAVFAQGTDYPYCLEVLSATEYRVIPCPDDPTPAPTVTSSPSATLPPYPSTTPTQETTMQPTWTPSPTNTPTATQTPTTPQCWGNVMVDALNVRDAPYGVILGQVEYGQTLAFDAKWRDIYGDWWWRFWWDTEGVSAWVASWLIAEGDTADCDGLEDVTPTKSNLVVGFFSMPNGNVMEQVAAVGVGAGKNIVVGTHPYANASTCMQVMDAGGVCSFRHGAPDCPIAFSGDPRGAARDFMIYDQYYAEGAFQNPDYAGQIWIDPLNECEWGNTSEELAWWGAFFDEYITQAAARGWPPLHLPSLGPGFGDYLMFSTWRDALQSLYDNGGMFAMHVYNPDSEWLCPFNEWLADRTLHNYEIMQSLGIDVRIAVTESGGGWGNTPPNIEDMTCWVERTALYPFVAQVYIWEVGRNLTWELANWEGKVIEFIQALDGSLWG